MCFDIDYDKVGTCTFLIEILAISSQQGTHAKLSSINMLRSHFCFALFVYLFYIVFAFIRYINNKQIIKSYIEKISNEKWTDTYDDQDIIKCCVRDRFKFFGIIELFKFWR